jgi:hypothetical protein
MIGASTLTNMAGVGVSVADLIASTANDMDTSAGGIEEAEASSALLSLAGAASTFESMATEPSF